jgi:hypothetical protein
MSSAPFLRPENPLSDTVLHFMMFINSEVKSSWDINVEKCAITPPLMLRMDEAILLIGM